MLFTRKDELDIDNPTDHHYESRPDYHDNHPSHDDDDDQDNHPNDHHDDLGWAGPLY